jgi:putative adenylate-forming enzyme
VGRGDVSRLDIVAAYIAARWRAATLHGPALRAWQDRRAELLVEYVRARSPFYRERWRDAPSSAWRDFRTVDKRAMMESFDQFTTLGVRRDDAMRVALDAEARRDFSATISGCTVGLSSGTSGHRGLFLVSPDEQTRWAGTILARAIPDLRPGHRVAFFLRANSRLYERTSSVVQFRFFDLMQPLTAVIAALNDFQPRLVVGPPSLLGLLADAQERTTLRIAPSRLISVAEVIEPQDRARIERTFQAAVGEVYQCTEGLVAVACGSGAMHVQEDVMVMQTEPVQRDDPSRVTPILTDLWRRAQPIVRYRLGDVLRLDATRCACGSTWQRIAAIEGRQDDLCWFPQADATLRIVFPDAIRRMILLADARIAEYRAEQDSVGELRIAIDVSDAAEFANIAERLGTSVRDGLAAYGCHLTAMRVDHGVPAPRPGAKRRRVICHWRSTTAASATPVLAS